MFLDHLFSAYWYYSKVLYTFKRWVFKFYDIDGLVQDCSNSIAKAVELLQSYPKPSIYIVIVLDCIS